MQAQDGGPRGLNGQEDSTLGWPRMRPAGMRMAGKSISLASLATEEGLQGGLKSTRSEDGEHRWVVRMPCLAQSTSMQRVTTKRMYVVATQDYNSTLQRLKATWKL